MMQVECEIFPKGSLDTWSPVGGPAIWKAVKPLEAGDLLEEVDDLGGILRFYSPAPLAVILCFLTKTTRAVGFVVLMASIPHHDGLYLPGTVSQN